MGKEGSSIIASDVNRDVPSCTLQRTLLLAAASAFLAAMSGFFIGRATIDENCSQPNTPPVPPAALPLSMLWRLALVEHHDSVFPGAEDVAFGNYYFDWSDPSGLVASRQENAVAYEAWRQDLGGDVPWNTFWAWEGVVASAYVDINQGIVTCSRLPYPYNASFWPRDFLTSCCKLVDPQGRVEPMPPRFGNRTNSFDGRLGVARACVMTGGGGMHIEPVVWLDPKTGLVLRFDIASASPGWNPQTWDILEQVTYPEPINKSFLAPPSWC